MNTPFLTKATDSKKLTTAIIDCESNSRATLRAQLMHFHQLELKTFSNPDRFFEACYEEKFDLVLCNYELADGKNGASYLNEVFQSQLLPRACGKVILSSDSSANALSQILDVDPDVVLIKPYNFKSLKHSLDKFIAWHRLCRPLHPFIEQSEHENVIMGLTQLAQKAPEFLIENYKLRAKTLIELQQYAPASETYKSILKRSSNTLWARWGLLKTQFLSGEWEQCKQLLNSLIAANIIKEKSYEWLACVSYAEDNYQQAHVYLDEIHLTSLSLEATKLKSHLFCLQDKIEDAIRFLDRKRQANLMLKAQFKELTYEIAKCLMLQTASASHSHKVALLDKAKQFVQHAGRGAKDSVNLQRRDTMMAHIHCLNQELEEAIALFSKEWMKDFSRANVDTLKAAVNAQLFLSNKHEAIELLSLCEEKMHITRSPIDSVVHLKAFEELEASVFDKQTRAKQANVAGTHFYQAKDYARAMQYFYKAWLLYPKTPAFSLNLVACLQQCGQVQFKDSTQKKLLLELQQLPLTTPQQVRFDKLTRTCADV